MTAHHPGPGRPRDPLRLAPKVSDLIARGKYFLLMPATSTLGYRAHEQARLSSAVSRSSRSI